MDRPGAVERILSALEHVRSMDVDPSTGRLFTYIYETGNPVLREIARRAFELFLETNALDPTAFKSAFFFERELVSDARKLTRAGEGVAGTVTYGGTESIMLAVKAARWSFRRRHGAGVVPEIVAPLTVHPSTRKAAHYLGMRMREAGVDPDTKKVDVEDVKELVSDKTALVVLSAPNFPYGVIDPVKEVAGYANDLGVPVHVDACLGGYILPYMEELGEQVEPWDFRVEGVSSISLDTHKYGYAPKGVSVLLFESGEYKEGTIFVDLKWPGYPLINNTVLSSRSIAPMAAAWAVTRYLGDEGYLELTRRVMRARDKLLGGLKSLGFRSVAPIESPLLALTLDSEEDLFKFYAGMTLRGWIFGLQPRVEGVAPYNVHFTVTPIHDRVVGEFLEEAREALAAPPPAELEKVYEALRGDPLAVASLISGSPLASIAIAKALEGLPRDMAEDIARRLAVEVYR